MPDIEYTVLHGVSKKLKDLGDGTHAEVVASSESVSQALPERATLMETLADWEIGRAHV